MYISSRNHTYYFRLKIPSDVRMFFGCREIKRSLATSDYKYAKTVAPLLAFKLKEVISMARNETLDEKTIKKLVDKHVRSVREQLEYKNLTLPSTTLEQAKEEAIHIREQEGDYQEALATRNWKVVDHLVESLLDGRQVDQISRNRLSRDLLDAIIKLHPVMEAYALGDTDALHDKTSQPASQGVEPGSITNVTNNSSSSISDPGPLLSEFIEIYDQNRKWNKPATQKEFFSTMKPTLKILGDLHVSTIERSTMVKFRETLTKVPTYWLSRHKDVPVSDLPITGAVMLLNCQSSTWCLLTEYE